MSVNFVSWYNSYIICISKII